MLIFKHSIPFPWQRPTRFRLTDFVWLLASFLLIFHGPLALAAPSLSFTALQPSPVEVYRGESRQLEYEFINNSDRTLKIESVFPRKGKGRGEAKPPSLKPGEKGKIVLDYTFPEAIGRGQVNFLVKTDSPDLRTQVIAVPYFVQAGFDPELVVIDFGDLRAGQRLRSTLKVSSRLVADLKLERVISGPEWMEVNFVKVEEPQSVEIVATTTGTPPFGLNVEELLIETNVAEVPRLRIPVVINTFSKYRITPFPVTLGAVNEGLDKKTTLRIQRWEKGDVRIRNIETGSPALKASTAPCGEGCMDLTVNFDSMRARAGLKTLMTVHFEDDEVPLRVPIDALVVPIGVKVKDLGDLDTVTVKSRTTIVRAEN
jgi:hypothetical protein